MTTTTVARVCFPAGTIPVGVAKLRHRAACHCGHLTTPRASAHLAAMALLAEHGWTNTPCQICGHHEDTSEPWTLLAPMSDGNGGEVYVCRDVDACRERSRARTAADTLKCGCSHEMVAIVGHYHAVVR